jgi:hypothetical protein
MLIGCPLSYCCRRKSCCNTVKGNFEDEDGNLAEPSTVVDGHSIKGGDTRGGSIEEIDQRTAPTDNALWRDYKYAAKMSITDGKIYSYALRRSKEHDGLHDKLCPGVYKFSMWAKRSKDYNGAFMIFHMRFFDLDGAMGHSFAYPHQPNEAHANSLAMAIANGWWPSKADQWELLSMTIRLRTVASRFDWYIMYPTISTRGNVMFTGLSATRLGGDGPCAPSRPPAPTPPGGGGHSVGWYRSPL